MNGFDARQWGRLRCALILLLPQLPLAPPAIAADPWTACGRAIAVAERGTGVPPGLMLAIARVESGRPAPTGGVAPWPFAINADGGSHFPNTAEAAIAQVTALRARDIRSVDVGCMQVNLLHHPGAFPDLDTAFDPTANVAYAAHFLGELRARTGNWAEAVAQYHSAVPGRGLAYHSRVTISRVAGGTALGTPRTLAGLCAPGRQARVVVAPNGRPRLLCRGR
ncbi:lytic transglycosylase domain-containing protein [Humitalea sp. 24SJ18S-53]|uniref:lytic transglycosylase domain-containing protein n=1 Tax=Humitalea sp. 24SJ18S-53 TaxID=3422307 RepID=UPI003D66A184